MMTMVVGTSHGLVPIRLDVVLAGLVVFHGGGTMTSVMQHMIAKLQLYSCFAEVLLKAQTFGYFPTRIPTSLNQT
jgi:hypothetical protein